MITEYQVKQGRTIPQAYAETGHDCALQTEVNHIT